MAAASSDDISRALGWNYEVHLGSALEQRMGQFSKMPMWTRTHPATSLAKDRDKPLRHYSIKLYQIVYNIYI